MIHNTKQLKEMAKQQLKTDEKMCATHNLDMDSLGWFSNRIIALTVELVETLQVTEKFKDWKINKGKIDPKRFVRVQDFGDKVKMYYDKIEREEITEGIALTRTLREECADVLHFVLSLKNLFDYEGDITIYKNIEIKQCVVNCMYELMCVQQSYVLSNCNFDSKTKEHFKLFVNYLFSYFYHIGIDFDSLEYEYWLKNKVNHQRIKEGY